MISKAWKLLLFLIFVALLVSCGKQSTTAKEPVSLIREIGFF